MPRKQFLDAPGGDPISYDVVTEDGYRLAAFHSSEDEVQKNFDSIPLKKCRNDDILLNSYPKTGTNWLWEMVTMVIMKQSTVTERYKSDGMLEATPERNQDALPSPRLLNTHVSFKYIPKEAIQKRVKCILLCRNPKDTVVSFYNHTKGLVPYYYDGKFENYLDMFMRGEVDNGCYATYLLEWQQAIRDNPDWPIHVVYYEDLKENGFEEMRKLCNYLGQDINDELLKEIVDNCQIDKLRQGKQDNRTEERKEIEMKYMKNNYNLIWKGQIGRWQTWFTVAQNQSFDQWWAEKADNLDMFKFRYIPSL